MELAANGHSTREIGEVLGVDHSTVVRDGANTPQDEKHDENTDDNLDVVGANAPPIDPEAERQREQETARVNHRPTMPRSFDIR